METRHTPGPWAGRKHVAICGQEEAGLQIGFLSTSNEEKRAEGLANAKLIVAAPDLLGIALRWAALDGQWHPDRYESEKEELLRDTKATIAKATA